MNKPEFLSEYTRLCKGFRYESTPEQSAAWYVRIGHLPVEDWREAVTTLLCNPRFPMLDPAMQACDQAGEHRRRTVAQRERMEAQKFFRGNVVYRKGEEPIEYAYNAMRMKLLVSAYQPGQSPKTYAQRHVDGLSAWISIKANAEWARATYMGDCGKHSMTHTVLKCITDEMKYWALKAEGKSEFDAQMTVLGYANVQEQTCVVCNGNDHEPGQCWPWHNDKERERRYRLPYWQERMRMNGLDPEEVIRRMKQEAAVNA